MDINRLLEFVQEHKDEDPLKLLLQKDRYPDVDIALAAQQIEGMRQASTKWPTLAACNQIIYPPKLNREQSSSEATAKHKLSIVNSMPHPIDTIADLTGGMGIDTLFLAQTGAVLDYVEQDPALCEIMEHNRQALRKENIICHCGDSIDWLGNCGKHLDLIFIDPARRDRNGRKVAAFEECSPDILTCRELLSKHCNTLMVKASPMIDIDLAVSQLGSVSDVHVVAVRNECKEVLFICNGSDKATTIHCTDIQHDGSIKTFRFTREEESLAQATYCDTVGTYLYEPNAAIMKGGAFKSLCHEWDVAKLSRNTHLYTSLELHKDFPGRIFIVESTIALNKKSISAAIPEKRAHVTVRNYPVDAVTLQKQTGLVEGGDKYVIACTVGVQKTGLLCRPA